MTHLDILASESAAFQEKYGNVIGEVQSHFESEYGSSKKFDSVMDAWAIGKYTQTLETYAPFMGKVNEAGDTTTVGDLGAPIAANLGLAAAQYATSIIPFLGTIQPTDQEIAIIYYKRAIASVSRGGVNAGDEIQSRFGKVNENLDDYTSDVQSKTVTITAPATVTYTIALGANIKKGSLNINVAGKITAIDNGEGKIFGGYIDPDGSSIDYSTGALVLKITDPAAAGLAANDNIDVVFTELLLGADVIPGFKYELTPESIPVRYWPLQVTYDSISDFVTKRRFGTAISEMATKDLIYQINKAVSFNAVKQLRSAAIKNDVTLGGSTTWSVTPPAGTSLVEHRRTFEDIYDLAISNMERITGMGGISAVLTGSEGRKIYKTLGIETRSSKPGVYVIGFQDGIPVIYVPTEMMPKNEVILIYKGQDWFETPLVYAPFLPVLSVSSQGRDHNVFQKNQGIATGAGLKVVNGGYCQRIILN